jgi:formamidopyrimidine-DNA glycosylase
VPELPEVETVRRSLEPALYEGRISAVETSGHSLRQKPVDLTALRGLIGARFVAARRHGKYLLLDTDAAVTMVVHLGMAGQLLLVHDDTPTRKHTHVTLALSSGRALRYVDPRRFGIVRAYPTARLEQTEELSVLGPDPIAGRFERKAFAEALSATRRDLKSVLLDQRVVAGLGNIYVSEALFEARLSPRRAAHRLQSREISALFLAIERVLRRGVDNRGTSFSDYVDAAGHSGSNQHSLCAYGRAGVPCRRCKTKIRRIVQGGRATFYCPSCQSGTGSGSSRGLR